MDSLSQLVLGASIGHLVLGNRIGRRALVIGAGLGTLPDLDVLVQYDDAVDSFTRHRSYSHSLFVLSVLSVFVASLVWRWFREKVRYSRCLLAVWLILITHPLLDAFTVYGTQIWWPLNLRPAAWSSLFIIDPLFTVPMLVGIAVALWPQTQGAGVHQRLGRQAVFVGLCVSMTYIGWTQIARHTAHRTALETLAGQGISADSVLAIPLPLSLLWRILVIDGDDYLEGYYSLLDPPGTLRFSRRSLGADWLGALAEHPPVARLQWFTGHRVRAQLRNDQLVLTDLRIGAESNYVFEFSVAVVSANTLLPTVARAVPPRIDLAIAGDIWRRMWDANVSLVPSPERDAARIPDRAISGTRQLQ